nr:PIN domain-containing protein [Candidatus Baldrarchaeota archaeon]
MSIKGRYRDFLRRIGLILIFDSYAWIEFFIGSRLGEKVRRYLEEGHEVVVPDIVLAEIARKYWREGFDKNL